MLKIGVDFGTTYSCVYYLNNEERLKGVMATPRDHNPFQPTMALIYGEEKKLYHGSAAREILTNPNKAPNISKLFTGFKMLLGKMSDDTLLHGRGYERKAPYNPEGVAEEYLKKLFMMVRNRCPGGEKIEKIVIGVPQIWFDDVESISARDSLQNILCSIRDAFNTNKDYSKDTIGEIILESEPALACAYHVYNYRRDQEKDFNGHVLLIDYGGGTLDINLCQVSQKGSDCEIKVRARTGKGLNDADIGLIGKAGMAFIDGVINKTETAKTNKLSYHEIQVLVQSLESELMDPEKMEDLRKIFSATKHEIFSATKRTDTSWPKFWDKKFADLSDAKTLVEYGTLRDAYNEIIEPIFKEALDDINTQMSNLGINPKVHDKDDFKIAFAGGFCNFYLTRMQVENYFDIVHNDPRTKGMDIGGEGFECAIACGAALVSAGVVKIKQTYPYTLGIANDDCSKKWQAFRFGDDMVYNMPKYVSYENGEKVPLIVDEIPNLYFDKGDGIPKYLEPLPHFRISLDMDYYTIGFSLDKMLRITVWVQPLKKTPEGLIILGDPIKQELPDLPTIFGKITDVKAKII